MNKLILILAVSAFIASSCSNRPNTIVEGNLQNAEKSSLRLEQLDINKTRVIDSLQIKGDGSFRFKVYVEEPGLYILKSEAGKIINLLVTAGEKIKIDGDYLDMDKKYSVIGSPESEFVRQLVEKLTDTRGKLKTLEGNNGTSERPNNDNDILKNEIIKNQRDYSIAFIVEHLSSMASIYALYQKLSPEELVLNENRDIQFMKIVADSLSVKYPNSNFVKTFVKDARTAEKRYLNLIGIQKKINEAQSGLPDLSFPDANGNLKNLSSLKGKMVLLYFWSVYSEDSKQLIPLFEKTYKKYKSKGFEIYAVCVDKDRDSWLQIIRFEDLSFINTVAPDFPESEDSRIYNLRSIPATYLMDREMNIIARDIYGADLEKWLDNTL